MQHLSIKVFINTNHLSVNIKHCNMPKDKVCVRSVVDTLRDPKVRSHLSEVTKLARLILVPQQPMQRVKDLSAY